MKKHFISGLLPFLILFGLNYGLIKAADLEIILGTSSAFNVVRGASVAGGTSTLYVGSTTVSIGTTTQSAMLTIVGSSTASSDSSLSARNSSGTYVLDVRNDGAVLIGTNTLTLNSALYVGSATSGSLGTITAGFLSMGTISANTGLHGTTTVRFLADIFANGTVTASKFSGDGSSLTGITATSLGSTSNINTTGTINAGSTTVSTLTTTGSITAGSAGGFKVDTAGSMTATTITSTGSVTASILAITGDAFKVDSAGSMTASTFKTTGSATVTGGLTAANGNFTVDTSGSMTAKTLTVTGSATVTGPVLIGTNTPNLASALYVGSSTTGSLGTITAGYLSVGTISANLSLQGTTTVRFLADIFANGTVTATGFSGNGAGLTGISVSGGLTGGNINTTGTINAGSTTVSTFTTTGSITAGSAGSFKVDTAGSMTATTITSTGSVTASILAITGDVFKVDSAGSMTAKTITATGSATITGPVLIGTNTPSLGSALYVGSSTTNNLGTITAGFLSIGTISANTSLHGTTTVRFLNDIYANGTITAAGNVKASGDIISTKNGMVVKLETAPMGEIYFTDNSTVTTIATATVFVKAAGVTTFDLNSMNFGTSGTNNKLVYTGTSTKIFHVAMTASYSSVANGKTIGIAIAKNGTTTGMEKSIIKDYFVTGDTVQSSAIHVMPVLSQNEYLEVFVTNFDAIGTVTVKTLNMFAMGMSNGND